MIKKIKIIALSAFLISISLNSFAVPTSTSDLLIVVEQTGGKVGFYDAQSGKSYGSVQVGLLPHEVIVSQDKKTAYVSNFGLQDYDETIGVPGASISVIDIPSRIEKYRLYTFDPNEHQDFSQIDKAPHGMRLRPPYEKQLYVNVEKGNKMLVFDINSRKIIKKFDIDSHTHNFIFSPDGQQLWLMAGPDGIIRINPDDGKITGQLKLSTAVRGLSYTPDNRYIMASAVNEIVLIDPNNLAVQKHFSNLGVGQLLYSAMTPDSKYIVAPAVWDSQVIIIDVASGRVIKRIPTGVDPVTVKISASGQDAYVTNARDDHVTAINLQTFETKNILTGCGPNGLAISKRWPAISHKTLTLGVPLPLSGKDGQQGRQMMLAYEYWRKLIKKAGGIILQNTPYDIKVLYLDTQSQPALTKELTEALINKDKVNILLSTLNKDDYRNEQQVALKYHIPIMPFVESKFAWKPNNIATGEDFFVTSNNFSQQFKEYYNLDASSLSAAAIASVINLQQALLAVDNTGYVPLTSMLAVSHFYNFLLSLNYTGSPAYASK